MAITLADFTKIWASTSPLTPYSFSDANYQEGWNFIGATPPARQMWDSIQKQNDEKLKYIVDNFLPTAGGTMTGAIVGNPLTLTADDGVNSTLLEGKPNGVLNWGGNRVQTAKQYSTTVTPASNFANYNSSYPLTVYRVGNVVQIYAILKSTTEKSDGEYTLFTLPSGYRPIDSVYEVKQGSGTTRWLLKVSTNGDATIQRYGTTSSTTIPNGAWLPFSVTFITTNAYPS